MITVAEELGVENRAGYYDENGALRDMVQNHLTQVLTLLAMEIPPVFESEAIRDEEVKVLKSIVPLKPQQVVFGQYTGYRDHPALQRIPIPKPH
jgi:glucose-6-phosphate 1-dehydrogenase